MSIPSATETISKVNELMVQSTERIEATRDNLATIISLGEHVHAALRYYTVESLYIPDRYMITGDKRIDKAILTKAVADCVGFAEIIQSKL